MHFAFAESKPISTYLIAFAAGPWTVSHSGQGTRLCRFSLGDLVQPKWSAITLLVTNQRALDWLEHYFDRPYPFAKFVRQAQVLTNTNRMRTNTPFVSL